MSSPDLSNQTPFTPVNNAETEPKASETKTEMVPPNSISRLLMRLTDQVTKLVKDEIQLAVMRAKSLGAKLGTGVALLAVAGVLALYMLGLLLWAGSLGFAQLWAHVGGGKATDLLWAGILTVCAILLLIILILAAVGGAYLKKAKNDKPNPAPGLKKSVEAAKEGLSKKNE